MKFITWTQIDLEPSKDDKSLATVPPHIGIEVCLCDKLLYLCNQCLPPLRCLSFTPDFVKMYSCVINREYYMALSVSHPVSTRDTNIIPRALARGLIQDVIRKEPYHIMFIIYLNTRKSCSVLWTFSHVINIILRGMIKGWWYRYQSRQTNTDIMFFQYYICKFPLFSTKYMIKFVIDLIWILFSYECKIKLSYII